MQNNQEAQLRNYVSTQLRNGYTTEAIKRVLQAQGYNLQMIDRLINENQNININVKHEVHIAGKTIFGVFFSLVMLGVIVYVFLFTNIFNNSEIPLLDVTIQSNTNSYHAGDAISYQIELSSTGSRQRFDANVRYVISDELNLIKKSFSETIAVETRTTKSGEIDIPNNLAPGKYYLTAIVDYGSKTPAQSAIEFDIIPNNAIVTPDITSNNSNLDNTSMNNKQNNTVNIGSGTTIIPSSNTQTFGDTIAIIRIQAKSNPENALIACSKFSSIDQKDVCYLTVADSSDRMIYCEKIQSTKYKDDCYLTFMINGNNVVCEKISDNSTKAFCNQIQIVYLMNQYYQQNNTDKIMELNKEFNPSIYNSNPNLPSYNDLYGQQSTISTKDIMISVNVTDEDLGNVSQNNNS